MITNENCSMFLFYADEKSESKVSVAIGDFLREIPKPQRYYHISKEKGHTRLSQNKPKSFLLCFQSSIFLTASFPGQKKKNEWIEQYHLFILSVFSYKLWPFMDILPPCISPSINCFFIITPHNPNQSKYISLRSLGWQLWVYNKM